MFHPAIVPSIAVIAVVFACSLFVTAQSPETLVRQETAARERVRFERFEHVAQAGPLKVGATYTGRTVIASARSVFVRNHLVIEVLVSPPNADGMELNSGLLQLRVNGEKQPRLPQTPELVGHYIRSAGDTLGPRLQASAGMGDRNITLDTGRNNRARFPGDPRVVRPPRPQGQETPATQDSLDADATLVTDHAFRGGHLLEPTAGYLYFPCELDLRKVKKLELLVFGDGDKRTPTVLRLK
ncbi:MAG: hypothetical protein KIT83_10330 [Bryobacterales bacterium]|nr:hypothetical protein [Bryobacterales bacterium]